MKNHFSEKQQLLAEKGAAIDLLVKQVRELILKRQAIQPAIIDELTTNIEEHNKALDIPETFTCSNCEETFNPQLVEYATFEMGSGAYYSKGIKAIVDFKPKLIFCKKCFEDVVDSE